MIETIIGNPLLIILTISVLTTILQLIVDLVSDKEKRTSILALKVITTVLLVTGLTIGFIDASKQKDKALEDAKMARKEKLLAKAESASIFEDSFQFEIEFSRREDKAGKYNNLSLPDLFVVDGHIGHVRCYFEMKRESKIVRRPGSRISNFEVVRYKADELTFNDRYRDNWFFQHKSIYDLDSTIIDLSVGSLYREALSDSAFAGGWQNASGRLTVHAGNVVYSQQELFSVNGNSTKYLLYCPECKPSKYFY